MKRLISFITALAIVFTIFSFVSFADKGNFTITDSQFCTLTDSNTKNASSLVDGNYFAKVYVKNNTVENKKLTLILALFKNNTIVSVTMNSTIIDANADAVITTEKNPIKVGTNLDELSLKMYIIYDTDKENPISIVKSLGAEKISIFNREFKVRNRWNNLYLCSEGENVKCSSFASPVDDKFIWIFEGDYNNFKIRNKLTGYYITSSADGMYVSCHGSSNLATEWAAEVVENSIIKIKNIKNNKYFNTERDTDSPQCNMSSDSKSATFGLSSQWCIEDTLSNSFDFSAEFLGVDSSKYPQNVISVLTPEYASDIFGDTTVKLVAPGLSRIIVKCWTQDSDGGTFGEDSLVATVPITKEGVGIFVFPGEKYPHGPNNIRIIGMPENGSDICNFQVYNTGGISWNEGLKSASVPQAVIDDGLDLLFEDDFDNPEDFTCSREPSNAKYSSHKPGFGDFSAIKFCDYESEKNPFYVRDTYLRIRANQKIDSAGLLCTVSQDREGIASKPPVYMECKLIAPNFNGSWPAFWTLTTPLTPDKNSACDELDVFEAYGFDKSRNNNCYQISSHNWGQTPYMGKNKAVNMSKTGGKGEWFMGFHTYAVYVTQTDTIYYLDNIEVYRCKTLPVSKIDYHYMLVNMAVGGYSGGPWSLERYNWISDMYIDYWRMWGKDENLITRAS